MLKILFAFVLGIFFSFLTILLAFGGVVTGWEFEENSKNKTKKPWETTPTS